MLAPRDGVVVASVALMAAVCGQLSRASIVDGVSGGIAGLAAIALLTRLLNSAWLVAFGKAIGVLLH